MYLIAVIICQILFSKLKKLHACNEGVLNHPLLILLTSLVLYDYCISSTPLSTTKLANLPTAWLCSSIPSLTTFNMSHNSVTHLMDQDLCFVPNIEKLNLKEVTLHQNFLTSNNLQEAMDATSLPAAHFNQETNIEVIMKNMQPQQIKLCILKQLIKKI